MTFSDPSHTSALFRQAQIHLGIGPDATPTEVAMATLKQAARNVAACLAQDPSIRLTLPVPHGLLEILAELEKEQTNGQ